MKIPKKIQMLLDRRECLAYQLMETCSELDIWLEENGANLQDADLCDCFNLPNIRESRIIRTEISVTINVCTNCIIIY